MENFTKMLPQSYIARAKLELGENYEKYIQALCKTPVRGLRVNTKKISTAEFEKIFKFDLKKLSFSTDGYLLESEEKLGNSAEHLSGLFYLQEPSSMLAVCASGIERENKSLKVLDLCASPGGKSGQIACRISDDSLLVSNEIISSRADVLYSNIERQGFKNVIVTNEQPEKLEMFEGYFDYVFVDAPCSGEGMFRKNPETIGEWSEDNVKLCASRQKDILTVAQKLIKPNGKLVYSTCTFSKEEDEEVVNWFLDNFNFKLMELPEKIKKVTKAGSLNGKTIENARKFYPFLSDGEGQFVAVFECQDTGRTSSLHTKKHFRSIERAGRGTLVPYYEWESQNLKEKLSGQIYQVGESLFLAPSAFDSNLQTAFDNLKFLSIGVKLGSIKNKRFEPNHWVFMAFGELFKNRIELDEEMQKKYLHGEELTYNCGTKGYGVVTYHGYSLGGVRIVQDKLKNLYPKGLRI